MALITHWCVLVVSSGWRIYIKLTKGSIDVIFGELWVSLLSKAVFTALVSVSFCLCWVWIVGGAKAVFVPKRHWLVPSVILLCQNEQAGHKRCQEEPWNRKKGAEVESLPLGLLTWSVFVCVNTLAFIAVLSIHEEYWKVIQCLILPPCEALMKYADTDENIT